MIHIWTRKLDFCIQRWSMVRCSSIQGMILILEFYFQIEVKKRLNSDRFHDENLDSAGDRRLCLWFFTFWKIPVVSYHWAKSSNSFRYLVSSHHSGKYGYYAYAFAYALESIFSKLCLGLLNFRLNPFFLRFFFDDLFRSVFTVRLNWKNNKNQWLYFIPSQLRGKRFPGTKSSHWPRFRYRFQPFHSWLNELIRDPWL